MSDDRDPKPDNLLDPIRELTREEQRREMRRLAVEWQPPGGLRRPRYFRGDYEMRLNKRGRR